MTDKAVAARMHPVLLIEDEPSVSNFVRAALERHGYRVTCAASGVISDMRTQGNVNGADVHAWINNHRPHMNSRLLFITGDIANDETGAILKKTGIPFIEKPFRVQQLVLKVEELFGKAK